MTSSEDQPAPPIRQSADPDSLTQLQIVVADDDPAAAKLLQRILVEAGYTNVQVITDPHEVAPACARIDPDLLLLDLQMPSLDGLHVLQRLGPMIQDGGWLPVIVVTGALDAERRDRALALARATSCASCWIPPRCCWGCATRS